MPGELAVSVTTERPVSGHTRAPHVCLITGGGDAPGLNAATRAFVRVARPRGVRVSASRYGFEGLLGRADVIPLEEADVAGISSRAGSILGCSTISDPFSQTRPSQSIRLLDSRLGDLGMDGLVLAGGDGTMQIARELVARGFRCIGIPKTIDGDLPGTERTCGLDTAIAAATSAIDALHATAEAHRRVMILEVMGRAAGWIALAAGVAGGADVALIPEIPYDPGRVVAKIRAREALGRSFSIVVVGEGARAIGGAPSEVAPAAQGQPARLGGAGEQLAHLIGGYNLGHDVRVTVLGHLQRGHAPTASDRLLGTRLGAHAADLCAEGRFGRMVVLRGEEVDSIAFSDLPAGRRLVDAEGSLVRCARALGIELGAPG
jgi:6-phosphofructokinase 1